MATVSGSTYRLKNNNVLNEIMAKWERTSKNIDRQLMHRVNKAAEIVYGYARHQRPKIRKPGTNKWVSNPNAEYGVPVKTGALRASIELQKASRIYAGRWRAKVTAGGPGVRYAGYMEYGTSHVRPRPFMRQAMIKAEAGCRRIFSEKL